MATTITEQNIANKAYRMSGIVLDSTGAPDTFKIQNVLMLDYVETALAQFADMLPITLFSSVITAVGVQSYDLPANTRTVLEVFYNETGVNAFSPDIPLQYYSTVPGVSGYAGDILEFRLNQEKLAELRNWVIDYGSDYRVIDDRLFLINAPSVVSRCYFFYTTDRPLSSINDRHLELIATKAAELALRAYALKNENKAGVARSGGLQVYGGGNAYVAEANRLQKIWNDTLMAESRKKWAGGVVS